MTRWRLLPGIELLLLLCVFLLHLLRLLLMLLLHLLIALRHGLLLLIALRRRLLLRSFLVFLLLLLRQLLMIFLLLSGKLLLLFLILLVLLCISGVRGRGGLMGRQILSMYWSSRRRSAFRMRGRSILRGLPSGMICRRMIRCARFAGCDCTVFGKCSRLWSRRNGRSALIHRGSKLRIAACGLNLLILGSYRSDMPLSGSAFLGRSRTRLNAAVATVVADAVHRNIVHGCVVNVMDVCNVYVVHRAVVVKLAVVPASALIPSAKITVPIGDSAVKTNLRSPIARVEGVAISAPTPIRRSPE